MRTPDPSGDPLSDVLDSVRLRGALFFLWEPGWPYATSVDDGRSFASLILPGAELIISYHVVTQGPCWGAVTGEPPVQLDTGDILLLPQGDAYVIASEPMQPIAQDAAASFAFFRAMARGEIPPVVLDGGPGPRRSRLVCGFLGCDPRPFNPLLGSLPRLIRVPAPTAADDPLGALVDFALSESRQHRGGERSLLLRLSEVMFIEVLRRYLRIAGADVGGWLSALQDPVAGRALGLLHRHYARPWTLVDLAESCAVSRSTLAERFLRATGHSPMQYLAHWRMQVAARRLGEDTAKVCALARELGYESEAAFSRAFKRLVGMSPAAWRAHCRDRRSGAAEAVGASQVVQSADPPAQRSDGSTRSP